MNPDIFINALFYENHNSFPLYNNPHRNRKHHINLLLKMDEKTELLIIFSFKVNLVSLEIAPNIMVRNMCALTACTVLQRNIIWVPIYQNAVFMLLSVWNIHHLNTTVIQNILKFKNFAKTLPIPMVLYCDFQTFLVPVEDNGTASKTVRKELYKSSGFSCLRVSHDPKYTGDICTYSGPDAMHVFFYHLKEQEELYSQMSLKWTIWLKKIKWSTSKQRIASFVVIISNMT